MTRAERHPNAIDWRASYKPAIVLLPLAIYLIARSLAGFAAIIHEHLRIHYDLWFELGMVLGQIAFQWCVLVRRSWSERLDYALILVGVSGFGAVCLWPLLLLNMLAATTTTVALGYFSLVVAAMFALHWKLVAWRGLPTMLCATWVLYRVLILFVVVR